MNQTDTIAATSPGMRKTAPLPLRYLFLMGSIYGIALGLNFIVLGQALGTDSWSILHIGITNYLPITFGVASQMLGIVLLLITWMLGTRPSLASLLNMIFVGIFFDWNNIWLSVLIRPETVWGQVACIFIGYTILGFAAAWCISANLGAGPRDQLMVTLVQRTGIRVSITRFVLEGMAALIGFALGGPLGWASLIGILFYGPIVEKFIGVFRWFGRWGILSQLIHIPFQEKGNAARRKSVHSAVNT